MKIQWNNLIQFNTLALKFLYILLAFCYSTTLIHKTAFFHDVLSLEHHTSAYIYTGIAAIQTIGSFAWSYTADYTRRSKLLLIISAFLNCALFHLFLLTPLLPKSSRYPIHLTLIALWTFSYSGIVSLFDTVIVKRLVALDHGREAVSRQKLWGSIGSGCTTFLVGKLIDDRSGMALKDQYLPMFHVLLVSTILFIAGVWGLLPSDRVIIESYEEKMGVEVVQGKKEDEAGEEEELTIKENSLRSLMCNTRFLTLLFAGFIVGYCEFKSFNFRFSKSTYIPRCFYRVLVF
jgi:hypothetical protein